MSDQIASGVLHKMKTRLEAGTEDIEVAHYRLAFGDEVVEMNDLIGGNLSISFSGTINCIHCGRETRKSFSQGYCFPCFKTLAECDLCIMRPETCHFHLGTCRDEDWANSHCMQDHYVYIANSSGLKVGITRGTQIPTRWIDQGAVQAIKIFQVNNRYHSGLIEAAIKKHVSDKTDWRKMLKASEKITDFEARSNDIVEQAMEDITIINAGDNNRFGYEPLKEQVQNIQYPVNHYPEKVSSLNLDKTPEVGGVLEGIKGQYLIFDTGVINLRKFAGYSVTLSCRSSDLEWSSNL